LVLVAKNHLEPFKDCDLWPSILRRIEAPTAWSWIDTSVAVGVAAGVAITLAILPKALLLLAYHL